MKYFMAKLFVRRENQATDPKDSFPRSDFTFNEQVDLLSQGIDLPNDGKNLECDACGESNTSQWYWIALKRCQGEIHQSPSSSH